jgi:NAD(P)H-hydrate epimerase
VSQIKKGSAVILTPHIGELEHLTGQNLTRLPLTKIQEVAASVAKKYGCTVVLKAHDDCIVDFKGTRQIVKGGNAGLTKGGTGDSLAGLIAGLLAQGIKPFDACVMATTTIKRAATVLYPEKGFGFTTRDLIEQIPHLLHTYK